MVSMRMLRTLVVMAALALLVGCAHGPAGMAADDELRLVGAGEPEVLLALAKELGEAEVGTDSVGDPHIVGSIDGTRYQILFHGCTDNADCTSVMFVAAWAVDGDYTDFIMNWNQGKRFSRASLDRDLDPTLEMDIELTHGVSHANLREHFGNWKTSMTVFRMELGLAAMGQRGV